MSPPTPLIWSIICAVNALGLLLLRRAIFVRCRSCHLQPCVDTICLDEEKTLETPPAKFQDLPQSITQSDGVPIGRDDWVQRLTHHVFAERHGGRYNVLTVHTDIDHRFAPEGVVERLSLYYINSKKDQVIPYDVIVFRKGTMLRLGDGGYINWCFEGNFERLDNFVTFKEL
ncbi:MAG: hypothetical protein M1840_007304 [Geoglossum simile]|nr:MAG: hypothetical protein M1840_007304 [Geoglossum simile]